MIDRVKHFNPFVAAATVKLYMLELNPPILGWEGWEDAKAVYPSGRSLIFSITEDDSGRRSGEGYDERSGLRFSPTAWSTSFCPGCCDQTSARVSWIAHCQKLS